VLVPGLVLAGAGMGLTITPLMTIVLAGVDPARAGAASGLLNTTQQVGNALGVAIVGVVFFGAADRGLDHGFEAGLALLAGLGITVALLSRLLPAEPSSAASAAPRPA
jgi:predicted MFS family arabinose efflux permease